VTAKRKTVGARPAARASEPREARDTPDLRERLRRALFIIPFAVAHPGCTVEELARAARLTPEELIAELDFLRLVGRPPFSPADLVDVDVVDGRVVVALPQGLSRPPSLTPLEAAALDAAASALAAEGGAPLATAREKLRAAVPPSTRPQFDALRGRVLVTAGSLDAKVARTIDRAIEEKREIELTYWTAARGEARRRTLRPIERVLHQGYWYLHAYCVDRRDRRLFRLDRAADLALTDRSFVPRPADESARFQAPSLYAPSEKARTARVRIRGPWAVPAQAQRLGATDVKVLASGEADARFIVDGEAFLSSVVLSLEGDAEVSSPPELRTRVREAALAAARRHGER
jgi:predicted DNA-binding transcriptional regulator YafY